MALGRRHGKGDGCNDAAIAHLVNGVAGLTLDGHIFCASAGDYYEIAGGNYRRTRWLAE